ncbi:hypothetical protein HMPREF0621_1899 [Pasteurella dagmatis ATCC 43325]|uniref:Uncharacterized protein n=1 Tax=Pasteurella dagmatis ATCC 43325 TaxID=667128 RepID=C9PSC5_9PAST|nr:hypothetical protein HMPREF0621_1899 [Pasteurella dagmatis ATCC 43325]
MQCVFSITLTFALYESKKIKWKLTFWVNNGRITKDYFMKNEYIYDK